MLEHHGDPEHRFDGVEEPCFDALTWVPKDGDRVLAREDAVGNNASHFFQKRVKCSKFKNEALNMRRLYQITQVCQLLREYEMF